MLTHNAPEYVDLSIRSVFRMTKDIDYELIVLDNASDLQTRELLQKLRDDGFISKLLLLERNSLFAEGNNIAANLAAKTATHFLLLNSDIEVRNPRWLSHLISVHRRGITSYGFNFAPHTVNHVDGYCLLIDADLFRLHKLDHQNHQWWWSVVKLQAKVLNEGYSVRGYKSHERYLHHFGGKSGNDFVGAKGMDVSADEVRRWFSGRVPTCIR